MISKVLDFVLSFIKAVFYIKGIFSDKNSVLFVPHSGMCRVDLYDIINYKSDSALSFLHYVLENNLIVDKKLVVATCDDADYARYTEYISNYYPNRIVQFVPLFANRKYSKIGKFKRHIEYCRTISMCSHIFSSITQDFSGLISNQIVVDLNYFTCAMKNDILDKNSPHYMGVENVGHEYNYILGTSEIAIRLTMPEMTVPYRKYVNLGLCRNDNVLNGDKCEWLREEIVRRVSYDVKTIVLYTPTHRDYETGLTVEKKRSVLGFEYRTDEFEQFLSENGIVFICKLHPKQNALVVENELPEGLILHKPDERYGLTELMQVSDALVTDYTSVYFDYLLLDKPIIFNFYDLEVYKRERGVPCEPMSAIAAGEIIENEDEMKKALLCLDENRNRFSLKRKFVRDLFFTKQDANTCKRVYEFIFERK